MNTRILQELSDLIEMAPSTSLARLKIQEIHGYFTRYGAGGFAPHRDRLRQLAHLARSGHLEVPDDALIYDLAVDILR